MSILKVKANGTYKQMPDQMVLDFNLSYLEKNYEDAVKLSAIKVEDFIDWLLKNGIKKEEYHTLGFHIEESYKNVDTGKVDEFNRKVTKRVLEGYRYTQSIEVKIDFNLDLLRGLMLDISNMSFPPRLSLNFAIKDMENAKSLALKDAYEKCKEKAKILADISNKKIVDCVEINLHVDSNYQVYECNSVMKARNSLETMEASVDNNFFDYKKIINPEEIVVTDSVVTIWEIN
jgi:uncharacterized protein YggE